jgi:hypothetical protein
MLVKADNVGRRLIGPALLGDFFPSGRRVLGFMAGTAAIGLGTSLRMSVFPGDNTEYEPVIPLKRDFWNIIILDVIT